VDFVIINNISSVNYSSSIRQGTNQSYRLSNPPNFGVGGMPTKSASKMSDEEIREKMVELAKKDFAAGRPFYDRSSSEYNELLRNYTSAVSPDRQGTVNNTLSSLARRLKVMVPKLNFANDLLSLLMGHSTLFNSRDIGTNFINFKGSNGNVIATFSSETGWGSLLTDAENARYNELVGIYNEAWRYARSEPQVKRHNEAVKVEIEALNEYGRVAAELKNNSSQENIAALNTARIKFEAAVNSRENINRTGNEKLVKVDAAVITAALERIAPGSTQQAQTGLDVKV